MLCCPSLNTIYTYTHFPPAVAVCPYRAFKQDNVIAGMQLTLD